MTGQLISSVKLTITPDMMPSFRFVAFYSIPWSDREEVVPDSIWVDVEDSCVGGVRSFIVFSHILCLFPSIDQFLSASSVLLHRFFYSVSQLKVRPVDGIPRDYTPGKSFNFQVRGDPGAKVGLVAVDNAVFLLNRDRLTQRKVCV